MSVSTNIWVWNKLYAKDANRQMFGDDTTAKIAAKWFAGLTTIEDWGCGHGGFKLYLPPSTQYIGIDGSNSRHADIISDLEYFHSSNPDGILLRHVLEHNRNWELILKNALKSFEKKLCIILFTPFTNNETKVIAEYKNFFDGGMDIYDIAFKKLDILYPISAVPSSIFHVIPNIKTNTQYGEETMILVERLTEPERAEIQKWADERGIR